MTNMKFSIFSKDYSGLGFAIILQREGCEVLMVMCKSDKDDSEYFGQVGDGLVDRMEVEEFMKVRKDYKDNYIIWDGNHNSDISEQLRKEGFNVFSGSELMDRMEHDREFGVELIKQAGLSVPETFECNSIDEGIKILEANEDKAFVFKPDTPDDEAWVTTCPDNEEPEKANEEIRLFLSAMGNGRGTYILQERKKGVEVNIEAWLYKGTPFFAHANCECKFKYNKDFGKMIGCAHDIEWVVPLESKIIQDTVIKLSQLPEFDDYTGFLDMNVIVSDRQYWFLEFCARFGYNSHPNLFINLAISSVSDIMRDFMDGKISDFSKHFREGFGASISLRIDKPVCGLPILIDKTVEDSFFHFDTCMINDQLSLAGYSEEVGIICAHDFDIKSAGDACLKKLDKIRYPCRVARTDLNMTDYDTNPWERYIALQSMKVFDKVEKHEKWLVNKS